MHDQRLAIDRALARICREELDSMDPAVGEAICYSLLGEGKRMRGILALSAYRAAGGDSDASDLAAAIEIVHAYSLVHDDLPCMDDDDMRRGRPTVHRAFGVRTATAAGVAMVPLAARAAARAARALELPKSSCGTIVRDLMQASGAGGMIGGQLLDLAAEGCSLTLKELERVHRAKTGALIASSVKIGGLAAQADAPSIDALATYGEAIGLAFQIADDVLDVTATTDELGKTAGRDLALRKSTYPALLGIEGAVERAATLIQEACSALRSVDLLTAELEWLARYVVERRS